jgi:hypothetical protein
MLIGKLEFTRTIVAGMCFPEFPSACFSTSVSSRILDMLGMDLSDIAGTGLKCICGGA